MSPAAQTKAMLRAIVRAAPLQIQIPLSVLHMALAAGRASAQWPPANKSGYVYNIVENFCTVTLKETGENGYALVEIGYNARRAK